MRSENAVKRIDRDARGLASRLYPFRLSSTEPCVVAIDPTLSFGRPTVEGSGVAVAIVADLYNAGEKPARIAREFGISKKHVVGAVEWQRRAAA